MNAIYQKNRTKRKYTRRPMCANLGGFCEFNHCRCNYPLIQPETRARIDEYLHHRQKVIKRRREVDMMKLDLENAINEHLEREAPRHFKGYIPEKKIPKHLLRNSILIFITLPIVYIVVVLILDLIK